MDALLVIRVTVYGLTLWFGLFLLSYDSDDYGLRFAGLGSAGYAITLIADILFPDLSPNAYPILLIIPAISWYLATLSLLNGDDNPDRHIRLETIPAILLTLVIILPFKLPVLASIPLGFLAAGLFFTYRVSRAGNLSRPIAAVLVATIFFGLGAGLLIIPSDVIARPLVMMGISVDLFVLGYSVAVINAYNAGETFLPEFLRSFGLALVTITLIMLQVTLVGTIEDEFPDVVWTLVIGVLTTIVILQVFGRGLQTLMDNLFLPSRAKAERDALENVANALSRVNPQVEAEMLAPAEFQRLTRRALSNLSDLSKLASSPLAQLPIVEGYIMSEERTDSYLERAIALKALLTEHIMRLKPEEGDTFGTTDEWRHFNALYYPYVVGLKPYNRRAFHDDLDEELKTLLSWFRTYVPERTLYNWQNAAAKLIAEELRRSAFTDAEMLSSHGLTESTPT